MDLCINISLKLIIILIYLGLISLSTYCTVYITMKSIRGRGNQYILIVQDSVL